jgi:hypothetical protein
MLKSAERCWNQQKYAGDQLKNAGISKNMLGTSKKMLETAPRSWNQQKYAGNSSEMLETAPGS